MFKTVLILLYFLCFGRFVFRHVLLIFCIKRAVVYNKIYTYGVIRDYIPIVCLTRRNIFFVQSGELFYYV